MMKRIVLVSAEFYQDLATTVIWLNDLDKDIQYIFILKSYPPRYS